MTSRASPWPLSVAPMMQRTDRHFRVMMRLITRRTPLYTEMISTGAILHGDRGRHLAFSNRERPLALQLGGDDPDELAECARIAAGRGYDEINLNVGCPSPRVRKGRFGAALMARPEIVARAVGAMRAAVELPVSVKHRIGVDHLDRYEDLRRFVDVVADAGCDRFIVHARKAWLRGLSPKENRDVPPLRHEDVHRLKAERPDLLIEINGGFVDPGAARAQLGRVDGVMVGRHAYENPYAFHVADRVFFGDDRPPRSRDEVVEAMGAYIEERLAAGERLHHITRHMAMLYAGRPGGKTWRRYLSEHGMSRRAGVQVVHEALELVRQAREAMVRQGRFC